MAASASTETPQIKEKEMAKHMEDLEGIDNEEELDTKLTTMSKFGFSIANWMKVLFNRDNMQEEFNPVWLTIEEYTAQAEESMQNSFRVINTPNWKLEKKGLMKGDVVESKMTEEFGKVYRFTGLVDCPAKFLFEEFKNNLTRLPEWNPTILKSELIKQIGPDVDLSYQVTAGGGRGIIAPRDFVILRRTGALSKEGRVVDGEEPYCYISSGVSVQVPGYPPNKDMVRGHNRVGCWYLKPTVVKHQSGQIEQKTVFQWLMSCDLKGKIPQFVLDTAFATVMLDYVVYVRKHAADSKAKGMF